MVFGVALMLISGTLCHGHNTRHFPRRILRYNTLVVSERLKLSLVKFQLIFLIGFFITFNNLFPIINQRIFNSYFERQYSTNPPAGTAWYALFNAVLCLGSIKTKSQREKDIRSSCLIDYTSIAQDTGAEYFRNASCCFHDLFFKEANLMSMQAMTLIVRTLLNTLQIPIISNA
jgi:hypothetical protein